MISFPSPTPAAIPEPQLPVQRPSTDSGSSAEGDKPFDSFLDTNSIEPKPKTEPVKARQDTSAPSSSSSSANDTNPGNVGDVRHIRNLKGKKVQESSDTTPTDTTVTPTAKKETTTSSDSAQKSTAPTLDDQIATALMSASQTLSATPDAKLTLTPSLTTGATDPKATLETDAVITGAAVKAAIPAQETVSPEGKGNLVQDSLNAEGKSNLAQEGVAAEAGNLPAQVSQLPVNLESVPLPVNGMMQGVTNSSAQISAAMKQVGVEKGPKEAISSTAKNAGTIKIPAAGTDSVKAEIASSTGETLLSSNAGTSIAMQHRVMSDSNLHPQTKAGTPSVSGDVGSAKAVDAAAVPSLSGKSADSFGGGQKNETANGAVQDLSSLQIAGTKEGSPAITETPVSTVAPTHVTQQAEAAMKQVFDTATKMTSDGRTNVELQVKLKDGTEIAIKLQMTEGRIQPTFKTDSTELRQAIEQNWSDFSSKSASGNSLIASPVFESSKMNSNDLSQQQGGRQQSQETWAGNTFTSGQFSRNNRGQGEPVVQQTAPLHATQAAKAVAPQTAGLDLYA